MLKAHYCKSTGELAPLIHNLVRLADKAGLKFDEAQIDLLAEVSEFNIEGRYPEMLLPLPSELGVEGYMSRIAKVLRCLKVQF